MTGALQGAQNIYGTGRDISAQRFRAGQDIAANIQAQMAALAGLQEGQGINQSNLLGQQAGTLAGIQAGAGQNTANLIGSAGQSLASAAMGQANAYNPANLGGLQDVGGMLGGAGQAGLAGGIAGALPGGAGSGAGAGAAIKAAALASDVRLKENIEFIGKTQSGSNLYKWDWNQKGLEIVGDQPPYGVLAQEIQETNPDAVVVGNDGYLRVDYSKV
jgi:hypothetical protein